MDKERYFIWKNMEKLQQLIDSLDNSGESTDSSEDTNSDELDGGEGE